MEDFAQLLPSLRIVDLVHEVVLAATGDPIAQVYFPVSGMISEVVHLIEGQRIEVAMIGRDSLLGSAGAFGDRTSLNEAIVQLPGTAAIMDIEPFRRLVEGSATFRAAVARHDQLRIVQTQQSAACNACHSVESRLSRWLLRVRDISGGDNFFLTQEFLAQMMGVQRNSVSLVAAALQRAGLINYSRGHIDILDVEGLKGATCECYETVRAHFDRLLKPA
jgi:CRP-like cAMP-binding protein